MFWLNFHLLNVYDICITINFLCLFLEKTEMPQPGSATETEGKIVTCSENQSVTGRKRESTVFFSFYLTVDLHL